MPDLHRSNLAPHPAALVESLRSIGYTMDTALADIIDNSITAEATQVSVGFRWNEGFPWIAITDNGHGMSGEELTNAMRFGSSSPLEQRQRDDLGRFGLGLKTASISQCRRLTVITRKDGGISACEWNLDEIAQSKSDDWILVRLDEAELKDDPITGKIISETFNNGDATSGTVVVWRELDASLLGSRSAQDEKRFNEIMASAKHHLETVFHRYLSPDSGHRATRMSFNGTELNAFDPFGPNIPARQELPEELIKLKEGSVTVQPFVLPHQNRVDREQYQRYAGEEGYLQNQGFYIYRNRRLIVKATWFRLIRKEELNKLIRVRVDIPNSLDHLWGINVNKSQLRPPEDVRQKLKSILGRITDKGKKVYTQKATKLQTLDRTPVWRREVSDGMIRYRVNADHPLIKDTMEKRSLPEETARALRSCISLIEQSFPFDACHADVANEKNTIEKIHTDENALRDVCIQVLHALHACGMTGEELRKQFMKTEIPGATDELLEQLLEETENA